MCKQTRVTHGKPMRCTHINPAELNPVYSHIKGGMCLTEVTQVSYCSTRLILSTMSAVHTQTFHPASGEGQGGAAPSG